MAIRGLGRSCLGALAVAGALVLAAGCGDDDEPAEEATTTAEASAADDPAVFETDPCSLLTSDDVKALMGKSVEGSLEVEGDAETQQPAQCLWESGEPVDLAAPNTTPSTIIVSAGDQAWYDNNAILIEDDESFEELDDLGDAAFAGNTRGAILIGPAGLTAELGISADPSSHEVVLDALQRVEANYEPQG